MPYCTIENGISIYYELRKAAQDTAETCVLIGGLTRDHTVWRSVLPQLEKRFNVLIFDNRDAGRSSISDTAYGIAELADDVADLLNQVKCFPAHVIGHSMGGFMAIHLAAKYPELIKSLILCSTAGKQARAVIRDYLLKRIELIDSYSSENATAATREDIVTVMDKIYAAETLANKEFVNAVIEHEMNNPYPQSAESFKRQAMACIQHDALDLLSSIDCPTLVMTGEHDSSYPPQSAQQLAEQLQHANIAIIPAAAHMVPLEQPQQFCQVIEEFIDAQVLGTYTK